MGSRCIRALLGALEGGAGPGDRVRELPIDGQGPSVETSDLNAASLEVLRELGAGRNPSCAVPAVGRR